METAEKDGGLCSSRPVFERDNVTLHNKITIGRLEVKHPIITYVVVKRDYIDQFNVYPVIYTSQTDIEMFINDISLSTSQCIKSIDGKSAVVWLKPVENFHMPYLFTVNEKRTGKLLKNDVDILTYSIEEIGKNSLLLSYEIESIPESQDTNGQLLPTDVVSLILEKEPRFFEKNINKIKQFPDRYRQVIHFQLNNMVKMKINKTSNRRPKHWPGETIPYPYYSSGGCDTERLGVGRIVDVKLINKDNRETSRVWKSQYPRFEKTEWIEVAVYTSRHVVFDDIEAKHTTCSLLLNDIDSDDISSHLSTSPLTNYTGNSIITFKGELVNMAKIDENWTLFTCTSDDLFISMI
ncbi:hypothetical protein Btru_071774 [Bulinus truncatus]|nr:hypothetical protein Btru_071774 [Bulinus truncatus]